MAAELQEDEFTEGLFPWITSGNRNEQIWQIFKKCRQNANAYNPDPTLKIPRGNITGDSSIDSPSVIHCSSWQSISDLFVCTGDVPEIWQLTPKDQHRVKPHMQELAPSIWAAGFVKQSASSLFQRVNE